ncbi:MAG: N-acetylglucosamine-6-phosphate deacetylase [Alphaproteobacteria bacterium]|nr:N-acetylglucosamine-6-phosphate deacetylase [Alphaproteobacteria bacterium]
MRTALTGGDILVSGFWHKGATLLFEDGKTVAILKAGESFEADHTTDIKGHKLVPGFVDVQVNGGGGALLNDDLTVDGVRTIAEAHRPYGTTSMLPTLISDDLAIVGKAIAVVDQALKEGVPGIAGIHIEGPCLSREKKGIHDETKFRAVDDAFIEVLERFKNGAVVVTVAPEQATPEMVARMAGSGMRVCLGHTNATYEAAMDCIRAGATGFTHLHNAMSPLTSRAPGVVGAALDTRTTFAGIIADGFHVHPASLRAALYAKGADHMMLVTDAMPCVGAKDKNFILQGKAIMVVDGMATGPDGTLAGSDLDMAAAVRNAVSMMGVPLDTAVRMASMSPARFLGLENEIGDIRPGLKADYVLLDAKNRARKVWTNGVAHDGIAFEG